MADSIPAPAAAEATGGAVERGARVSGLHCRACGSREPVRAPARAHGWQRCRHCGLVIVAPWSDWEAFDGPNARSVVLEKLGRSHFIVPRRTLLSNVELAAWLFIVNTLTAFGVGLFEIEPTPGSLWRWLGPLLCLLVGLSISALFVRLWSTVQHVEISPRRILSYRTVGQGRYRVLERATPDGVEVDAGDAVETVSENRFYVRVRDARTQEPLASLILPTRREADWVAVLLRRAAGETSPDELRCGGCGAPLPVALRARAEGSAVCTYCDAGFVVGAREVRWAPLVVPSPEEHDPEVLAARRPVALRNVRRKGRSGAERARSWEVLPGRLATRVLGALGLSTTGSFFVAFGVGCVWISGHTPPGAAGLSLYMLFGAAMMFGIGGYALLLIGLLLFGSEEIGVDEATVWTTSRLAGFDLGRFASVPAYQGRGLVAGAWRPAGAGLPLLRLTEVETSRELGFTRLRLATPTRRIEVAWHIPPEQDRQLRREIAAALAERVQALGREVVIRPVIR